MIFKQILLAHKWTLTGTTTLSYIDEYTVAFALENNFNMNIE